MKSSLTKQLSSAYLQVQPRESCISTQPTIDKLLQEKTDIMIDTAVVYTRQLTLLAIIMLSMVFLFINLGKRFLDFPQKNFCCYCCDSSHGCGIVKPDWLRTANATFKGT